MPQQPVDLREVYDALSDPVYEQAFLKAMTGNEMFWSEPERAAALRAKKSVGVIWGPEYPPPWRMDPTLNRRPVPPPAEGPIKAEAHRTDQPE